VPIVEDGFDGSLHYGPRPPAPLKAADRAGVVIYIGTFSKILFPGLRLGWLVAPPAVVERLHAAKQLADLHTSALLQAAVHRFCERRLLDRHVTKVTAEYARRRTLLLAALRRRMPEAVTWTEPQGGFSLLLTLPPGLTAAALLPAALERGVAFTPGPAFFLDGGGERTLRLAFSSVAAGRIDEGVRRLAETIKGARRQPRPQRSEYTMAPVV
jgi:2-aminoadipate transaminase